MLQLNSQISFCGLKQNLRVGEDVLRSFKKEFPALKSNTLVDLHIMNVKDTERFQSVLPDLRRLSERYGDNLYQVRREIITPYKDEQLPRYVERTGELLKKKPYANCSESSYFIKQALKEKGETPTRLTMDVINKKNGYPVDGKDHVFNIFGLKENADPTNPKTWGNQAVVVDAWSNFVMEAKNALETFNRIFKVDQSKHEVKYSTGDMLVRSIPVQTFKL
ncbi:MAG: hypothetical protein PHV37_00530 [Candidatus Gastranaerophilales bacterium]|nr:hypothetical protein [Candidatus Gastranaerophilales bacterium]